VAIVAVAAFTIGTSRMKSAPPVVDRSALQIETVRRGPLVHHVSGLGVLVPEETRWLAAETEAHLQETGDVAAALELLKIEIRKLEYKGKPHQ